MADIQVNGETLRSGAKDTDAVAAGVAQARNASGAALADNAFGLMCSPLFLPTYTLVKTAADAMMVSAEKGLRNSATALRGTATAPRPASPPVLLAPINFEAMYQQQQEGNA